MKDEDIFKDENIPESNWFKFDKVGAKVAGEVTDITRKESNSSLFPAQRVFTLKKSDGSFVKVGIKETSDYLMGRTNMVQLGDWIGFEFKKEIPAKTKGHHPAKSIEVYVKKGTGKSNDDGFGI